MSPRYLLLVRDEGAARRDHLLRLANRTGLELAYSNGRLAALVNPACACVKAADRGCILGTLFHRRGVAEPLTGLGSTEAARIASGDGEALLRDYWGGYVAALVGPEGLRVLRDPSGTFPCYYSNPSGMTLFASDADLLASSGASIDVDFEEIGRQFYRANVPAHPTALRGISELLAGFALDLEPGAEMQEPCWNPWDHVAARSEDAEAAGERLSRTIAHCTAAWASGHSRLLLSVSGGLDSSIIAACLARASAETACLTIYSDDPAGDERAYARALCSHLGLPLIERPYRLEDIDIAEPLAPHLPRPRDRTQANAFERVNLEVAREIGADAFVTGNGGDNVLGYSQSAVPVADIYLARGIGPDLFQSLLDVCRQTGCSLFDALRQGWRLVRGPRAHRVLPKPLFLDPGFLAGLGPADLRHEWLDAPDSALPGKSAHISSVLRAQPTLEASRGRFLPVLSPLMSQPIVECCLEVPSWNWRKGGRDRSLARRAFANDLPAAIVNRRVKGTPSRFAARLLDHFREPIRDRLLGGRLAANRIIDTRAVGLLLEDERPVPDLERVRILELVNAEAWIEHWILRRQSAEQREPHVRSAGPGRLRASAGPIP